MSSITRERGVVPFVVVLGAISFLCLFFVGHIVAFQQNLGLMYLHPLCIEVLPGPQEMQGLSQSNVRKLNFPHYPRSKFFCGPPPLTSQPSVGVSPQLTVSDPAALDASPSGVSSLVFFNHFHASAPCGGRASPVSSED